MEASDNGEVSETRLHINRPGKAVVIVYICRGTIRAPSACRHRKQLRLGQFARFRSSMVGLGKRPRFRDAWLLRSLAKTGLTRSALSQVNLDMGSGHSSIQPLLENLPSHVWKVRGSSSTSKEEDSKSLRKQDSAI